MDSSFEDKLHLSRVEDRVQSRGSLHFDEGVSKRPRIILVQRESVFGPFRSGEYFVVIGIVETKIVGHFAPTDERVEEGEKSRGKIPSRLLNLEQTAQRGKLTRREESGEESGKGGGGGAVMGGRAEIRGGVGGRRVGKAGLGGGVSDGGRGVGGVRIIILRNKRIYGFAVAERRGR